MRAHRTALTLITTLALCAAPIGARGGDRSDGGGSSSSGSSGCSSDSKSTDDGSHKGSAGGRGSSKGSGGGGGDGSERGRGKGDPDKTGGSKDGASADHDREWSNGWGRDRNRDGDNGRNRPPRCPNGRRNCRDRCCNPYDYGNSPDAWRPSDNDGWGFPWPDYPKPGRDDEDDRDVRAVRKNVELRISPQNVEVFVNGIRYSKKGNTRVTLPSGHWTIEIRADGYMTEILELDIKQGDRYRIERKLQRDRNYRPPVGEERRNDI